MINYGHIRGEEIAKKRIVWLPVENLFEHPDNPRKELGDISELVESIKEDGVLQNLTVVKGGPGVPPGEKGWTVIIGHRRRAAAIEAGLKELPCVVAEMDPKKQLSTMLVENMNRTDLTVYEQAKGFQMMLDLGETEKSIAKMTGFSETTVRRRVKLNKLDEKLFKESQGKNISLGDYMLLTEIEDDKERSRLMADLGTRDFEWRVTNAIAQQNNDRAFAKLKKQLQEDKLTGAGKGANLRWDNKWEEVCKIDLTRWEQGLDKVDLKGNIPKKLKYERTSRETVAIYKRSEKKKAAAEEQPQYEIDFEKQIEEIREKLNEEYKWAFERRMSWMGRLADGVGSTVMFEYILVRYMKQAYASRDYETRNMILPKEAQNDAEAFNRWLDERQGWTNHQGWMGQATLFMMGDKKDLYCLEFDWKGSGRLNFRKEPVLEEIYSLLTDLGYEMSTDEEGLMDGTHYLFEALEEIKAEYKKQKEAAEGAGT